jgi:hypothetical protein
MSGSANRVAAEFAAVADSLALWFFASLP